MLSPWIRLGATPSSRDQFLDKIEMIGSARQVEGPFACYITGDSAQERALLGVGGHPRHQMIFERDGVELA